VLTGSTLISAGIAAEGTDPARDLATLTLLVGVILLLARVFTLGSLIDNISEGTLVGVKIGVGLTVAAGQVPKLLGIEGDPTADAFFGEVRGIIDDLGDISWTTVALSAVTIAILLGLAKLLPQVPAPLVAVVLGIALVAVWSIDEHGVALIEPVPSGLPVPVAPSFEHIGGLVGGAFAIAIMCFLETASVAGAVRRPDEPAIDNDQELAANGVACMLGGIFRAMPSAGGFSQTAINQRSGARTQLSEIVTALLAVACALFLGAILSDLPQATLGCMVVVAVIGLIKPSELRRFWRLDKLSFWVAVITAAAGLVFGLLAAVLVGVVLTLGLVLHELNATGITELQPSAAGDDLLVAGPATSPVPGLLILRINGPLYTANVRNVHRRVLAAVDAAVDAGTGPRTLVIEASAIGAASVTVMDQFADFEREVAARNVSLWIAALPPRALATARLTPRWEELDAAGRLYPTALSALHRYAGERD
jgi:SulP family sulfate permease